MEESDPCKSCGKVGSRRADTSSVSVELDGEMERGMRLGRAMMVVQGRETKRLVVVVVVVCCFGGLLWRKRRLAFAENVITV
jgi:hypothetical protein